jgi:Domain of Unknown Function (DUF1259)
MPSLAVHRRPLIAVAVAVAAAAPLSSQQPSTSHDLARAVPAIEAQLGRKGAPQPGGVVKFSFPRSDLSVTIGGVALKPSFALGSWIAFADAGARGTMAMGDLVLTSEEVAPVMRALQRGGVEQTALHNHLLMESPRVMYLHIRAHGQPDAIARTIREALAQTKTPLTAASAPPPPVIDLDTSAFARALGRTGRVNGGVYQVSVPRDEEIKESGRVVPASMGVATAINIQPVGAKRALATGDFVLRSAEINPVIRALAAHGIDVTAIHSHMLDETPRLYFMHFWGDGDPASLAVGLRAALDATGSKKP